MTGDVELETWREEWQHPGENSGQSGNFNIHREVRRKKFRLRLKLFLGFTWAIFLMGFSYFVARRYSSTEMFLWALVVWLSTLAITGYSFWNWRSLWTAERKPACEYVQIYEKHCLAGLREIRFGYYFLVVNLVIGVPWISWRYFQSTSNGQFGLKAYLIGMGLIAGLTAGYLIWFPRSRRNRLRELEQVRQYIISLDEDIQP
jgi:membrane protease YdiL (CAAX protease family)